MSTTTCTIRRCTAPAAWSITSSHHSPIDARPFSAVYCDEHAQQHLALASTVSATRFAAADYEIA